MSIPTGEGGHNAVAGTVVSEAEVRVNYGLNAAKFILTAMGHHETTQIFGLNEGYVRYEDVDRDGERVLIARHTHDAGELLAGIYDGVAASDQVDSYYFVHSNGEIRVFEDDMIKDRELEEAGAYEELYQWRAQKAEEFLSLSEPGEDRDLRHLTKILHEALS